MADGAVGCDSSYAQLPIQHDAAYYEAWNRERQEAVARYVLSPLLSPFSNSIFLLQVGREET